MSTTNDTRKLASSNSLFPVTDHLDGSNSRLETVAAQYVANYDAIALFTGTHGHHISACLSPCSVHCPTSTQNFCKTYTLKHVEQQIERHRVTYFLPLYRKKKSFLPVSQLPWYILTDIFLQTQTRGVHDSTSDHYVYDLWTLCNITATCYAWRHAARSDARLWIDIHCSWHPELVQMYWQLSSPNLVCARVFEPDSVFKTDW